MSIITKTKAVEFDDSEVRARQVEISITSLVDHLLREWNRGWDTIWNAPNPANVIAKLDTSAAEVFELNEQFVNFLTNILAGRRDEDLAQVLSKIKAKPETTTHKDGKVTIGKPPQEKKPAKEEGKKK